MIAAAPAIYYVSAQSGADTNPGTMDAPWQHLAAAVSRMKPGDLLLLKLGDTWPAGDCIKVSGDGQTFSTYGSGKLPTFGAGCKFGIDNEGFNDLTVQGLHVTGTIAQGIFSIALKDGQNQRGRLLSVTVDNTGDSGIYVRNRNAVGAAAVTGWQIVNSTVGKINRPAGLNYQVGGIQTMGLTGALIQNNQVHTITAMGIQDRYFYNAACGQNVITKNRVWDNEGNITGVCPNDEVSRNYIHDSRGFAFQVGWYGNAFKNIIAHLKTSTDGTLYNGIDGKGAPYAKYSDNDISDVSACAITVEDGDVPSTGVVVSGGTVDVTSGGGCAVYVTAKSMPVTFKSGTTWKVPKGAKVFKMGSLGLATMQNLDTFLQQQTPSSK